MEWSNIHSNTAVILKATGIFPMPGPGESHIWWWSACNYEKVRWFNPFDSPFEVMALVKDFNPSVSAYDVHLEGNKPFKYVRKENRNV